MSVTSKIRKQLEQPNGLTPELLEPLAAEYARAVGETNRRLEECVSLLKRGLRSESLQRATIKPHVLDAATDLDFPELADFIEILQFYALDVPESLDRDAIAQLNEAFVEEQPLEELLRQHRRLALAKAPLAWRLKVLRQIALIDSMNPVWMDDLREWEQARIKQIAQVWDNAKKTPIPTPELATLREELESTPWIQKPPSSLVSEIADVARKRIHESKVAELENLARDIHNAYAAGDEHGGASLAATWTSIVETLHQPPPSQLLEEVAPALEWIEERSKERENVAKHEALCSHLRSLLQQPKVTEGDLQRAYHDIESLQLGVDPLLERQFATRLREIQQATRRKQVLYLVGIVSTTLALMVGGGLWYWNHNYRLAVANTANRLTELLGQEQLSEAMSIYTTIQSQAPSVAAAPEIMALKTSLDSKLDDEKRRSDQVKKAIDAADAEQADSLDINSIANAEKIAKTAEEKSRIARIRARFEEFQQRMVDEDFQALRKELQRFELDLERILGTPLMSIQETELDEIIASVKKLLDRFPRATVPGTKIVNLVAERASSLRESVRKQRREMAEKQTLMVDIRGASTLREFERQLRKFVDSMPTDTSSIEFREPLSENKLWTYLDDWNTWCNDAILQVTGKLDPNKASTMLERSAQLTQNLEGLPGIDAVELFRYRAGFLSKRESLLDELMENLSDSVILEIVAVESSTGKRSFIHYESVAEVAEIKTTASSITTIPVISDANGGVSNREFRGTLEISTEPRQFVRTLIRDLGNSRKGIIANWETEWIKILDGIVNEPKVDGKIKELLLARVSIAAQDGSSSMTKALTDLQNELFRSSEVRGRWFVEAAVNDQINENVLKKYSATKVELQRILKEEMTVIQGLSRAKIVWAGSLLRDSTGAVAPSLYREDIPDGTLVVVAQNESNASRGRIIPVGLVRNRVGELHGNVNEAIPGRPLFWIRATQDTK